MQTHRWDARIWLPEHSRWTYPLFVRATCRKFLLTAYRWQLKLAISAGQLRLEAGRKFSEVRNDPSALELAYATLNAMKLCQRRPAGFYNDLDILLDEDLLRPGAVISPTLVIHDPLDPMAPVEHRDWTIACVSHAERCDVHSAGHMIWVGLDAQAMHRRRVEFLKRHVGGCTAPNQARAGVASAG